MTSPFDDGKPYATLSYTPPTATDNEDTQVDIICDPPSLTVIPQTGLLNITCMAKDDAGNQETCKFYTIVKGKKAQLYHLKFAAFRVPLKRTRSVWGLPLLPAYSLFCCHGF